MSFTSQEQVHLSASDPNAKMQTAAGIRANVHTVVRVLQSGEHLWAFAAIDTLDELFIQGKPSRERWGVGAFHLVGGQQDI